MAEGAGADPELAAAEGVSEAGGDEDLVRVIDFFFERQLAAAGGGAVAVAAFVGDDAVELGPEVAALKVRDGVEGGDEGLLGGVIGGVEVAGEAEAEVEDAVLMAVARNGGADIAVFVG